MRARVKLRPGQRGTKQWLTKYGDQLLCVRYRYDAQRRMRYTTVELIVAEAPWTPPPPPLLDACLYYKIQVSTGRNLGGEPAAADSMFGRLQLLQTLDLYLMSIYFFY